MHRCVCVAGAASINCVNVVYVDLKFGARCILRLMSPSVLLYCKDKLCYIYHTAIWLRNCTLYPIAFRNSL